MKFWPNRSKTKSKRKSAAKGRARCLDSRVIRLIGVMLVLVVTGLGLLSWSRTESGRSTLLKLGATGLRDDVRLAMEESLQTVLPDFVPGPADSLIGSDNPRYDWLTEDDAIRCRVVTAPAGLDYWQLQDAVHDAVAPHGGEILWGERLQRPRRRRGATTTNPNDELLRLDLALAGRLTHTLLLHREGTEAPALRWTEEDRQPLPSELLGDASQPTVAIVIDDWGHNDTPSTRAMLKLDIPFTMSILPGLRYSRRYALAATELAVPSSPMRDDASVSAKTAEDLRWERGCPVAIVFDDKDQHRLLRKRREVMLHLPMEPQGYPKVNPGENAILVGMTQVQVEEIIERSLTGLPNISGVNNHMGSAATADRATMDRVMQSLKARGLLFVDSKTAPESVAEDAALAAGLPTLSNRYFLDQSTTSREQVRDLFSKVIRVAEATGSAVAICHPYPETIDVLRQEIPRYRRAGIRFVTVSELLALKRELVETTAPTAGEALR